MPVIKLQNWIVKDTYKPHKPQVDLRIYAPLLAKELGGTVLPSHWQDIAQDNHANIAVGNVTVHISRIWNKPTRIEVSVTPNNIKREIFVKLSNRDRSFESATFDTARDIAAVAKGIQSRVIDANEEAFARANAAADVIDKAQFELAEAARDLKNAFGDRLDVNLSSDNSDCKIWGKGDVYVNGSLRADGSIYFDRLGTIAQDKARRILAILLEK